jgi:hypothetical protein
MQPRRVGGTNSEPVKGQYCTRGVSGDLDHVIDCRGARRQEQPPRVSRSTDGPENESMTICPMGGTNCPILRCPSNEGKLRHIRGQLLIITDAHRCGDVVYHLRPLNYRLFQIE